MGSFISGAEIGTGRGFEDSNGGGLWSLGFWVSRFVGFIGHGLKNFASRVFSCRDGKSTFLYSQPEVINPKPSTFPQSLAPEDR